MSSDGEQQLHRREIDLNCDISVMVDAQNIVFHSSHAQSEEICVMLNELINDVRRTSRPSESVLRRMMQVANNVEREEEQDDEEVISVEVEDTMTPSPPLAATTTTCRIDPELSRTDYSWSTDLDRIARDLFKIDNLRPLQRQAINATLLKRNCLLILQTGGGKSLCFQLPALVEKSGGVTVVISPLIALMEDQVASLKRIGVAAETVSSSTPKEEAKAALEDLISRDCTLRFLYVTPERLVMKTFINKLEKAYAIGNIARFAIDEIHCCSQWGHDFRKDYEKLHILKSQFPLVPILGLTATATTAVIMDVCRILKLPVSSVDLLRGSINRPNLFFEMMSKNPNKSQAMQQLLSLIRHRFTKKSGIIYCLSQKESEEIAMFLQSNSIKAGAYHAGLPSGHKSKVLQLWNSSQIKVGSLLWIIIVFPTSFHSLENRLIKNLPNGHFCVRTLSLLLIQQIVVATIAFGLGVNNLDATFVIHWTLSKSLEGYYQEAGRCGRSGQRSNCVIMFSFQDVMRLTGMVFEEYRGVAKIEEMLIYCIGSIGKCRRKLLCEKFEEKIDECEGMCDACAPTTVVRYFTFDSIEVLLRLIECTKDATGNGQTFRQTMDRFKKIVDRGGLLGISIIDQEFLFAQLFLFGFVGQTVRASMYTYNVYFRPTRLQLRECMDQFTFYTTQNYCNKINKNQPPEPPRKRQKLSEHDEMVAVESKIVPKSEEETKENADDDGMIFTL